MVNKEGYKSKVIEYIDKNKDYCITLLQELIRIPSENFPPLGYEKKCQEYLAERYKELGLRIDMFTPDSIENIENHPGYLKERDYKDRPNLIGIYKGMKSTKKIMLSAHVDVVPVGNPNDWTVNPWSGLLRDGKVYGRGACDDKEGLAAAYMALKAVIDCNIKLDNDVVLASVVDEEGGGANGSLAAVLKYPCNYYIYADGVNFDIAPVSVSGGRFKIEFETKKAMQDASNCLDAMYVMRNELKNFEKEKLKEFESDPLFNATAFKSTVFRILEFKIGDETDLSFANSGIIKAYLYSTKNKDVNEKQLLECIDSAYEKMDKSKIHKPKLSFYRRFFNGAKTDINDILVKTVAANYERVTGEKAKLAAGAISDLPIYYEFGKGSCICFGIGTWDTEGACHMPDEFVKTDDLIDFAKVMSLTLIDLGFNE
ncbi:MAG: M20/M25/M40 family metallo-hydrolase [Firmicutes bacterium]|nr:M20/M25/M40 family metallo-hydrolase [Bacillota bacterium]